MDFKRFCEALDGIERVSSNTETIQQTSVLFQDCAADSDDALRIAARFVQGRVFPAWKDTKLDVGPSMLKEALAKSASEEVTAENIDDKLREIGEIGAVAESLSLGEQTGLGAFSGSADSGELTVEAVFETLTEISEASGPGSQGRKRDTLFGLFNDCSGVEARFLSRLVSGQMRIEVGEGFVRDAIADAFDVPVDTVEYALQVSNDYGKVAVAAATGGVSAVDSIEMELGNPVKSMLAQTGTAEQAVADFSSVIAEAKYDGERAQIHYDGDGEVVIASRNMVDITAALPEVVEWVEETVDAPVILDGEIISVTESGEHGEFEDVLQRGNRKKKIERMREEIPIQFYAFDCLYHDGEVLLPEPLTDRRATLEQIVPEDRLSDMVEVETEDEIESFFETIIAQNYEGVMLKNPESRYQPGNRGQNWLKLKPDVETVDVVVIGGIWGESRRGGGIGSVELGVSVGGGEYVSVGKMGTGTDDEELEALLDRVEPHIVSEDGMEFTVEPEVVIEVGTDKIQKSPTYDSGFALRFPRFEQFRDELSVKDADSLDRIKRMYEVQQSRGGEGEADAED